MAPRRGAAVRWRNRPARRRRTRRLRRSPRRWSSPAPSRRGARSWVSAVPGRPSRTPRRFVGQGRRDRRRPEARPVPSVLVQACLIKPRKNSANRPVRAMEYGRLEARSSRSV
ncbi:hypothetical protein FXF52_21970 [Micromonospora sp. MP36]|nr:hypothetical protein FXF52_21970 [Micromonospora sp. MP36]